MERKCISYGAYPKFGYELLVHRKRFYLGTDKAGTANVAQGISSTEACRRLNFKPIQGKRLQNESPTLALCCIRDHLKGVLP